MDTTTTLVPVESAPVETVEIAASAIPVKPASLSLVDQLTRSYVEGIPLTREFFHRPAGETAKAIRQFVSKNGLHPFDEVEVVPRIGINLGSMLSDYISLIMLTLGVDGREYSTAFALYTSLRPNATLYHNTDRIQPMRNLSYGCLRFYKQEIRWTWSRAGISQDRDHGPRLKIGGDGNVITLTDLSLLPGLQNLDGMREREAQARDQERRSAGIRDVDWPGRKQRQLSLDSHIQRASVVRSLRALRAFYLWSQALREVNTLAQSAETEVTELMRNPADFPGLQTQLERCKKCLSYKGQYFNHGLEFPFWYVSFPEGYFELPASTPIGSDPYDYSRNAITLHDWHQLGKGMRNELVQEPGQMWFSAESMVKQQAVWRVRVGKEMRTARQCTLDAKRGQWDIVWEDGQQDVLPQKEFNGSFYLLPMIRDMGANHILDGSDYMMQHEGIAYDFGAWSNFRPQMRR